MSVAPGGAIVGSDGVARCWWCVHDPLYRSYHDLEWGRPTSDDARLFEKLCLESFQSGLSWLTILRKRENFRRAFKSFDIVSVARFNSRSVERLVLDPGIVRNRAKIEAVINNARRCLELREEFGSLGAYAWMFEVPARRQTSRSTSAGATAEAVAMSKDLKRRGWSFVGPTTVYSFMQATGLVNDHVAGCACRGEVEEERLGFTRPNRRDR